MIRSNSHLNSHRVVVAMSGGVDSSVAAALLKKQGFDVVGIFMRLWAPGEIENRNWELGIGVENKCCNVEALEGARRVAEKLKIPLYTINFVEEFRKYVVDYYIKEYKNCRTPNPCVICNKFIKFDFLLKKAKAFGADYLATGHYVRLWRTNPISPIGPIRLIGLFQAKDATKDQSYFLWALTQEQLKHLLFPIGNYTKEEVRKMAKKWQLPTAERAESQGLCFIGYWSNRQFLEKFIHPKPGPVKDLKGNVLGTHEGLPFYTIGQRKGLPELRIKNYDLKRKGEIPPLYVLKLDQKNNTLIVGEEKDLYQKELLVEEVNWIGKFNLANETNLTNGIDLMAKIRYGHPVMPCKVSSLKPTYEQKGRVNKAESQNPKLKVVFSKPVRAITPGQSIVFYKGEELLGGGVIK